MKYSDTQNQVFCLVAAFPEDSFLAEENNKKI